MKTVYLDNQEIPYKIAKKKNKNTYFYFKKDGYIQINLSQYQTEKEILTYMADNARQFAKKYQKNTRPKRDESVYKLWGKPYQIHPLEQSENIEFIEDESIVKVPLNDIDHKKKLSSFERNQIRTKVFELVEQYQGNPYVDIADVHYTFRNMSTRHGSCNKTKRRISLSIHLIHVDPTFIEYVFLHEICHLKEANHGPSFYKLLEKLCPNYKQLKKELKEVW